MTDDMCPATNKRGEPCGNPAGWGTRNDSGPCRYHGGCGGDVGDPGGAPKGNQNARRHGLHSDPADLLDDLAENEPDAYEWVMRKYDSYVAAAPFEDGSGKADQLKQIAVKEYAIWQATGLQIKEGIIKRTHRKDSTGEFVEVEDEHPANQASDRMERTITRRLKELGVLDDPDSQQADALHNLANDDYEIILDE